MAFFFGDLKCDNVMVAGWRDGTSNAGKPYCSLTVTDEGGNTNTLSSSEPETIQVIHGLKRGDVVDLRIVCAGGPKRQYAMIARGSDAVRLHSDAMGY